MRSLVKELFRDTSYAATAVVGAVILFACNVIAEPSIVEYDNWAPTVAVASIFMLVSMAQAPALLAGGGGIDLSVGPLAGFVAVIVVKTEVTSPFEVLPLMLGLGVASGLVIGILIAYVRVPPIIATLSAYLFYTGLAIQLLPAPGGHAPGWISELGGNVGPIPGMWIPIALIALFWIGLTRTAFRRNLLAVGGEARAAFTAGVDPAVTRVAAYVLSGLFSSVAAIAFLAVLGSGDANAAPPYTLISLAGAALGGVVLSGGRGGLLGAAAGGATLYLIQNLLDLAGVSVYDTQIAFGGMLLLALALNSLTERWRKRRRSVSVDGPVDPTAAPLPQT